MKLFKQAMKFSAVPALLAASNAHAAIDPAVTTAITTGGTDAATLGGAFLLLCVGIAVFRHIRSAGK